ncbi:DUF4301 family protein [Brumimicrobium mesophilum]|uniref:DUF4301 family protein n=1 Tax=Brumimicrobium mesophilum TaxID=392717 RepID=UPI000D141D7F|nr:DUF4301 family protein [Brumimicrobium mesophilum]
MDLQNSQSIIDEHKELVFKKQPEINLISPCRLNDGIIRHSEFEKNRFKVKFNNGDQSVHFFIPASGTGSRMFKFLYEFLSDPNEETRSKTERFLNSIESFAFFELLPYTLKKKVREYDITLDDFVSYLLKPEGLGLGMIPKGLVPFHRSRSFILNAFQEQLIQGLRIKEDQVNFHFTINKNHEHQIKEALDSIRQLSGRKCKIEWSEQDPSTNSIAFDKDQNVVLDDNGEVLTRPSGHGALLKNLNTIESDIIFIKNIDNIQHEAHAQTSIENLKYLGGMLDLVKTELKDAYESENPRVQLAALNHQYHFTNPSTDFEKLSDEELQTLIFRPIRICGMVRNEGQPGGGPFWVEENGKQSKQIVEKSQISNNGNQYRLMVQSQYFNPVLMAVSTKDINGKKLDLLDFSDPEKYFIVEKTYEGKDIRFIERPGLWNGSMSDWISVFVEVPTEAFTPVKNVLDLLDKSHIEVG